MLTVGFIIGGTHLDQRWKLMLNMRCFARFDYRSQFMNSKYFGLAHWHVQIVIMISYLNLLDKLYLHKMIADGKRRKDKKISTPFHFALPPKNSNDLQKSGVRWIFEPIVSGVRGKWHLRGVYWLKHKLQ
jgi:hypothetical protein